MRTHTGEKPYKCTKCNYQSTGYANIVKHMRTHDDMSQYQSVGPNDRANQNNMDLLRQMGGGSHTQEQLFKPADFDFT